MVNLTITTVVDYELHKLCKELNIDWKTAIEQGIYMLLIDKGHFDITDLPKDYNKVISELARVKAKAIELAKELEALKNPTEVKENATEQADEFFKDLNGGVTDGIN